MRYHIWKKDDFFLLTGERIDMDPSVVELPDDELVLVQGYRFEGPMYGKVTDIRLEDGEITGEATFFDLGDETLTFTDEKMKMFSFRLGGYYRDPVVVDGRITSCNLTAVSICADSSMPGFAERA